MTVPIDLSNTYFSNSYVFRRVVAPSLVRSTLRVHDVVLATLFVFILMIIYEFTIGFDTIDLGLGMRPVEISVIMLTSCFLYIFVVRYIAALGEHVSELKEELTEELTEEITENSNLIDMREPMRAVFFKGLAVGIVLCVIGIAIPCGVFCPNYVSPFLILTACIFYYMFSKDAMQWLYLD